MTTSSTGALAAGDRVLIYNSVGVVRYVGPTQFADGEWVGVELDYPVGDNDGEVEHVRYFSCSSKHGVFMRPNQVRVLDNRFVHNDHDENCLKMGSSELFRSDLPQSGKVNLFDDCDLFEEFAVNPDLINDIRLWVFGENHHGQLGLGHQRPACLLPTLLNIFNTYDDSTSAFILNIVIGGDYSLALVCDDQQIVHVMSVGISPDTSGTKHHRCLFKQIDNERDELIAIAASERIYALCFKDGSVQISGKWSGQSSGFDRIRQVQCSDDFVVVCDVGGVTLIGCDLRKIPVRFPDNVNIVDISCRAASYLALSDSGSVWNWNDSLIGDDVVAKRIEIDAIIKQIACGNEHYLALSNDSDVYSWGSDKYGCIGTGAYSDQTIPVLISCITHPVIAIAAGAHHSVCLTDNGSVYTWGDGTQGQGHGDTSSFPMPRPVLSLENKGIRQIGAGPNQTFAYANKFVGPDKVSQGLDQFFADTRSLPSLREHHHVFGSTHYDDPVIMDVALNNSTIERILKQMTWRFDSKPYNLDVIQCERVHLSHRSIHFEVDQDISYRGAVNSYIRICYERHNVNNQFLFKNLSVSKRTSADSSKLRCTLLIICNDNSKIDDLAEIPDWISLFIEAFYPLDVNPRFVLLCPVDCSQSSVI